jgi:predicted MPP superfamily phosphohydrolase
MNFDYPMESYCIFYQEALCCKFLLIGDQETVDTVVLTLDYFGGNSPNYRQFKHFLEEVES